MTPPPNRANAVAVPDPFAVEGRVRGTRHPIIVVLIAVTIFTVAFPTIKERMGKAKYERPEDAM